MWTNIERSDLDTAIRLLRDHNQTEIADKLAERVRHFAKFEDSTDNPFLSQARREYESEGEVEFDDDAVVSEGEEGAYVMGWFWVRREEKEEEFALQHAGPRAAMPIS